MCWCCQPGERLRLDAINLGFNLRNN